MCLGNREVMSENIQFYMDMYGKTRNDVCDALGIKYTTFTDWLKGNTYPRIDKIEMLARYFGITKADLVERRSSMRKIDCYRIPIYGSVSAGPGCFADGNITGYIEIPERLSNAGECFALRVRGDSMEPEIRDGDIVIARKSATAKSGSIVIAVDGEDGFCKRLSVYGDMIGLLSINQRYEPMFYRATGDQTVQIIGEVVRLVRDF